MRLTAEKVHELQRNAERIRNICIMAHVDHGKTSLSDSLLATNGIISQRMAGKVRYLDSRQDEQLRGITMEASAISLYFKVLRRPDDQTDASSKEPEICEYLINLIDSPGHIDFSSEVSSASRLCDAAIVLVDVVEGVCSQTVNVLRQCWVDSLKPLLVLNKIDRLITEWRLTPYEAYQHLSRVIEQVNSVIGSLYSGERMEDDLKWREKGSLGDFIEKDDKDIYFDPQKNNVVFASAVDGWAFSVNTFAKFYLVKLGFSQAVLSKTLWGDFYFDAKSKKILPASRSKSGLMKPLFASLVLEQIWSVYNSCVLDRDESKIEKIIAKLGAQVSQRELRSKEHKKVLLAIMQQWIPVSQALLSAVIDYLPSPVEAQSKRIDKLLGESGYDLESKDEGMKIDPGLIEALKLCDSNEKKYSVAYTSKLISVDEDDIPRVNASDGKLSAQEILERGRRARELARIESEKAALVQQKKQEDPFGFIAPSKDPFEFEYEDDFEIENNMGLDDLEIKEEKLLAVSRIYSGTLEVNDRVTIIAPKYDAELPFDDPKNVDQVIRDVKIEGIYLMMGKELLKIDKVSPGNIVAIEGLENSVIKNATIFSGEYQGPFLNLSTSSALIHNRPIMKIAIEPTNPLHLERLEKGLNLLAKSDPVLEWYIDDDSGELILCVAGELHLERSLKDLEERFAKGCDVVVKAPVIPFREGLTQNKSDLSSELLAKEYHTDNISLSFDAYPLPQSVTDLLIENEEEINHIVNTNFEPNENLDALTRFKDNLKNAFEGNDQITYLLQRLNFKNVDQLIDSVVCFGPKRVGPNILVESSSDSPKLKKIFSKSSKKGLFNYEADIINGFQISSNDGPLAGEPFQGVLVVLKECELSKDIDTDNNAMNMQGKMLKYTKDLIHRAFLASGARLMLAMYTCDIQATAEVLGKVYAVVQRREGSIISEEMKEGTPFFTIVARVPVVEAFGFSEDIRKKTSGAATPQLMFDGFDLLDIDPFWVPHTEEELEELGEFAERENIARKYMNTIRRRKGLFVDEKVVKNAEKQRTLKKD